MCPVKCGLACAKKMTGEAPEQCSDKRREKEEREKQQQQQQQQSGPRVQKPKLFV